MPLWVLRHRFDAAGVRIDVAVRVGVVHRVARTYGGRRPRVPRCVPVVRVVRRRIGRGRGRYRLCRIGVRFRFESAGCENDAIGSRLPGDQPARRPPIPSATAAIGGLIRRTYASGLNDPAT